MRSQAGAGNEASKPTAPAIAAMGRLVQRILTYGASLPMPQRNKSAMATYFSLTDTAGGLCG
jgi:hypothetical protein